MVHDPEQVRLFKWNTLRAIGPRTLKYEVPVVGTIFEVELTSGHKIDVFRADDGRFYFCHGLTFGGKEAPGGPITPFSGESVRIILANHYQHVDQELAAVPGDILVWRGLGEETPHSAILIDPVVTPGMAYLDYATTVRTKNGRLPETEMTLEKLTSPDLTYGDSFNVGSIPEKWCQ